MREDVMSEQAQDGIKHFDGTVEKVDSEGTRSMSSYIDEGAGERLASEVDQEQTEENLKESGVEPEVAERTAEESSQNQPLSTSTHTSAARQSKKSGSKE